MEERVSEDCVFIEDDEDGFHEEIREAANAVTSSLLPIKSKEKYEKEYHIFIDWCQRKKIKQYTEDVCLAYFFEKSKKYKSSSVWTFYSMLRSILLIKNEINISEYKKLQAFLKQTGDSYKPKKSKILTKSEIDKFIQEAPDDIYLMIKKLVLLMEDTDNLSNCSQSSKSSELPPSDLSTLSGLSEYEEEFLDLKRLANPVLCVSNKNLKKPLKSSIKYNEEYAQLSNEYERKSDILIGERIEYLTAKNKQLELNLSAANRQIQRLLNTCSINNTKSFETAIQNDEILQLEKTNNELITQNSLLNDEINQYLMQKNEVEHKYESLKCELNDLKLELLVKENCIKELKKNISEQHVELQRLCQDKVQLSHSIDVLSNELLCKTKSEDWYKQELHELQNQKIELQKIKSQHEENLFSREKTIEHLSLELNKCKSTCEELRLISLKEKEKILNQFEHVDTELNKSKNSTGSNVTYDIERFTNYYENVIHNLNNDIMKMKIDFESQQELLKNALIENSKLVEKYSFLQNSFRKKEIAVEELEIHTKEMAHKLNTLVEDQTEKNKKLLHSSKMCVKLKIELDKKNLEKESVEQSIQYIKEQFKIFKNKYTNLKSDLHKKNKEFVQLLNEKQELDRTICDMSKTLKKQLEEIDFLKKEIVSLESNTYYKISHHLEEKIKEDISSLKEENDGFIEESVNFSNKCDVSTTENDGTRASSSHSEKDISSFHEHLKKNSFINLLTQINKICLPDNDHVNCVEHYNFSITDKQKNYLKIILNAVLMRLRFTEREILSKANCIEKQNKTIFDLKQHYRSRLENVESKCKLLWEKCENNSKMLDLFNHSRSRRADDKINHFRTIIEVKIQKEREKQKQYEKNYRTLLKKVKEHMKGRRVAEKHGAYLSELNNSLSEKCNTLELELDLKNSQMKDLQSRIENYSKENEKFRLAVYDAKEKMSVNKSCSVCAVLEALNRSEEDFLSLVKRHKNSTAISSKLKIWEQLVEEKQQLISEISSIKKSYESNQSKMEAYRESHEKLTAKLKDLQCVVREEKSKNTYLENELTNKEKLILKINTENIDLTRRLQKSGEKEIYLQRKIKDLNRNIDKKSDEVANSIRNLEQQLHTCKHEIDRMKNEKFFLQRLCSDLKFALKVHITHNKALKEHITIFCTKDEKVSNFVILTKFPTPSTCDEDKINKLLHTSVTTSSDVQEQFNYLKNGFLFLQKQISERNFGF